MLNVLYHLGKAIYFEAFYQTEAEKLDPPLTRAEFSRHYNHFTSWCNELDTTLIQFKA
jgi:hypothetical protein